MSGRGGVFLRRLVQRFQYAETAAIQVFFYARAAGALSQVSFGAIFTGQKSAGQLIIRDDANSIFPANRLEVPFVIRSIVQIVKRLQRFVSRKAMFLADVHVLG